MARWHSANVLKVGPQSRQVWQFETGNGELHLLREQASTGSQRLSDRIIAKDWRTLWQKKLNIAWLPEAKVFLRVLHLPTTDRAEILPMVELQLEKISPLPVGQIVWTLEVLPSKTGDLQTAIVMIAPRDLVEEFLGQLEGQGYLADRLELPSLDKVLATDFSEDGVWLYPASEPGHTLAAWWYGGRLQNLSLVSLPAEGDAAKQLSEQLAQIAWAGELEGWMTSPPKWHLVADAAISAVWAPVIESWSGEPVKLIEPLPTEKLAALSAKRAVAGDARTSLLPADFSTRYQQQFVDRLWMRGLGAILVVYIIGVLIYMTALGVVKVQQVRVQADVDAISASHTNAVQLRERVRILEGQANLKFAALESWKAVAEAMPSDMSMTQMSFDKGKTLRLYGTVPENQRTEVGSYRDALRAARSTTGERLFEEVGNSSESVRAGSGVATWSFSCTLRGGGLE